MGIGGFHLLWILDLNTTGFGFFPVDSGKRVSE